MEQVPEQIPAQRILDFGSDQAAVLDQGFLQEVNQVPNVANSELNVPLDSEFPLLHVRFNISGGMGKKRDLLAKADFGPIVDSVLGGIFTSISSS
ncbi:hypothetical protein V6N12_004957 [Hibiscus sabdariffa]|uniref:Uncharacterized protein n=1 Tax=Hibiscus sabdariffa TaxID=183260 RepID=A0ABR2CN25_9ROSI